MLTPKEARAAWVAALRSGEYKQGTGTLARVNEDGVSYCCLGLACKLAVEDGLPVVEIKAGGYLLYETDEDVRRDSQVLPPLVGDWLGLASNNGRFVLGDIRSKLARVNNDPDCSTSCLSQENDAGASFVQIADIVESEPVGLLAPS